MTLKQNIGVALLITLLALFLGYGRIDSFPKHIHAWAEAGQYSITLGFLENDFNFFEPETYVLNPQFPSEDSQVNETGITAVDFPIFQYVVGLVMKISNNHNPFVYRLIVMLYSCLGLFFLFKLSLKLTKSKARALFILLFVSTSPVFVYYQTGMLISMPALSSAFISFYFLLNYLVDKNKKHFLLAILFISLAAAIRTTYLISFGAIGLSFLIEAISQMKIKPFVFLPMIIGLLFIIGYRYHNYLLTKAHGSIFLNEFLMAESLDEFLSFMKIAWNTWKFDYFSRIHYFILGLVAVLGTVTLSKREPNISEEKKKLFLIGFSGIGASLVFLVVMSQQFPQHDYYFLDTFFLPLILLLLATISVFPRFREFKLKYIFLLMLFIPALIHAYKIQERRTDERYWNELLSTVNSLEGVNETFECLGIKKDAKILILGAHGGNLPLLLMERKGYSVLRTAEKDIREAMEWDYDYMVIPQSLFLSKVYSVFPNIIDHFDRVGGNAEVGIFSKSKTIESSTVEEFLGLTERRILQSGRTNFETKPDSTWSNINRSFTKQFSGNYSISISNKVEFGLDFRFEKVDLNNNKHAVYIKSKAFLEGQESIELVMTVKSESNLLHYDSKKLNRVITTKDEWVNLKLLYELPALECESCSITFYVWNNGRNTLFLDDLSIELIASKKDCI